MCQYFSKAEELLNSISSIYETLPSNKLEDPNETKAKEESEETKENRDKERLEVCEKIRVIGVEIYNNLNLSVIQGSYVKNSNFENRIIKFNKTLSDLDIPGDIELYECISDCFTKVLINSLKQYQYLTHQLQVKNNNPDKVFLLYDFKPEPLGNYHGDLNFDLIPYAEIFHYNILISILDRDFCLDSSILKELYKITHDLQRYISKEDKICKLLIDKCNLLIFKFISKYNSDEYYRDLSISHDFNDIDIDFSKIEISYLNYFKEIIANAYPPKREENYSYLKKYYQAKNEIAKTFEDYFIFVQFYRKVTKKIEDINQLINSFKNEYKLEENLSGFQKRSYNICLNYLYNNKISLLSKKTFERIGDIDSILDATQEIQNKTGIYNFFPYAKIAKCYINYLKQIINRNSIDNNIINAQKAIQNLKTSIDYLKKYLERNTLYSTLPFRPNYDGCCCEVKIDEQTINVFIASAYVIPVNNSKYANELYELESDYQSLKAIIETQEFINSTKQENEIKLNSAIEKSEEAIRIADEKSKEAINAANDSQKNNIQILSVFAALVVFAMGNFQVYQMVKTFQEALVFTLTLTFSLCSFSIVIWFIVSKKEDEKLPKTHKRICWVLAILLGASILAIFSGIVKSTPIVQPTPNNSILQDSLKKHEISIQNNHNYYYGPKDTASIIPPKSNKKQSNHSI